MMKGIFMAATIFVAVSVAAQQPALLVDKEALLTPAEQTRLDSLLRSYRERTDNLVTFSSDTADVSQKAYKDSIAHVYASREDPKGYSAHLLASRKQGRLELSSNNLGILDQGGFEEFMKTITYGLDALKAGRREEGFTTICRKMMEFLDTLPPKH